MNIENKALKDKAYIAKFKLMHGEISYEEALEQVKPYIDAVNEKSKEIAKKYGMRPKLVNAKGYLR